MENELNYTKKNLDNIEDSVDYSRLSLYRKVFSSSLELLYGYCEKIQEKEQVIKKIREELFHKIEELNLTKYDSDILKKIISQIKEFQIELQLSALNAKIKSLDMKEFSNIISVIGISLQDESFKIALRFNELKKVFDKIIDHFSNIEADILTFKKVHFNLCKNKLKISKFIENNILSKIENNEENLKKEFYPLIELIEKRLINIYFIKNSRFYTNIKKFQQNILSELRKANLLLEDYSNFLFKINYLTLITKIEVGKLDKDIFIMVINTLEKVSNESKQIFLQLKKMINDFHNNYIKLEKFYSEYSLKARKVIFKDYFNLIDEIKEDLEALMKFLKNEIDYNSAGGVNDN